MTEITESDINSTYKVLEYLRDGVLPDEMGDEIHITNEAHYLVQDYESELIE